MDGMRPRPQGMNFQSFMSHLPNPRVKQYKGPFYSALGVLGVQGMLGAPVIRGIRPSGCWRMNSMHMLKAREHLRVTWRWPGDQGNG